MAPRRGALSSGVGSQEMPVQLRCDAFDLWVFRRDQEEVRYLVLHTSQEKADRWFNGGRFWQIPGEYVGEAESIEAAAQRCVETLGLKLNSVWAVEHTYMIYSRRRQGIEAIVVLAADVTGSDGVSLSWEHSEYRWATAHECEALFGFRHLKEGLAWTRQYVTEAKHLLPELRLK
jgi:hypothetical protein